MLNRFTFVKRILRRCNMIIVRLNERCIHSKKNVIIFMAGLDIIKGNHYLHQHYETGFVMWRNESSCGFGKSLAIKLYVKYKIRKLRYRLN